MIYFPFDLQSAPVRIALLCKNNIFVAAATEDPGVPRQREGPQPGGGQNELHQSLAEPPGIRCQPLRGQVGHQALQSLSEPLRVQSQPLRGQVGHRDPAKPLRVQSQPLRGQVGHQDPAKPPRIRS